MDITKIKEAKVLIDNFIRLQEIESHLQDDGYIVVAPLDRDNGETDGLDYISRIKVYIPAPLRAAFLSSTRELLKNEASKIKEL